MSSIIGYVLLFLSLFSPIGAAFAADMEITPFSTFNQTPLNQIYGLPRDASATVVPPGTFRFALNQDLSNNFSGSSSTREEITLDGETYRIGIATRYGIAPRWEVGIEVPYLVMGGGFLDNFIIDWHNTFGMRQKGRDSTPTRRINYIYHKDGTTRLRMNQAESGIGDISATVGFSLYETSDAGSHDSLALKGGVKIPTGNSSYLLGSGSTDIMLQLCGSMNSGSGWGSLGAYGSIGAVAMSRGDVLSEQHNPLVGFGTLGFGWGPASWISFKVQVNGNTPFYHGSSLPQISGVPLILLFGGALKFPEGYLLDIGVGENLSVGTAPDVSFHLGLSKNF